MTKKESAKKKLLRLYSDEKSKSFVEHLMRAYCNKKNVVNCETPEICCILTRDSVPAEVSSVKSTKHLCKPAYEALLEIINEKLETERKVQFIVEREKAVLMFNEVVANSEAKLNKKADYSKFTENDKKLLQEITHIPAVFVKDGRAKQAWDILRGEGHIALIPTITLDSPLHVHRMCKKVSGATIGDLFDKKDLLKKLRK